MATILFVVFIVVLLVSVLIAVWEWKSDRVAASIKMKLTATYPALP